MVLKFWVLTEYDQGFLLVLKNSVSYPNFAEKGPVNIPNSGHFFKNVKKMMKKGIFYQNCHVCCYYCEICTELTLNCQILYFCTLNGVSVPFSILE